MMRCYVNPFVCVLIAVVMVASTRPLWSADDSPRELSILYCGNSYLGHYRVDTSLAAEMALLVTSSRSRLRLSDWGSFRIGGSSIRQRWEMTAEERAEALQRHGLSDPSRRECRTTLPDAIANGGYRLVVLQQHSKARAIEAEARPLVEAARAEGVAVILFMTWRSQNSRPDAQQRITQAYQQAGSALGVPVLPIGEVWQRIRVVAGDVSLYVDNGHPSALAHHINALALYRWITGSDLSEIPSQSGRFGGPDAIERERLVRAAVAEVIVPHAARSAR